MRETYAESGGRHGDRAREQAVVHRSTDAGSLPSAGRDSDCCQRGSDARAHLPRTRRVPPSRGGGTRLSRPGHCRREVASGRWVRVRRGAYVLGADLRASLTLDAALRPACAVRPSARPGRPWSLSHTSSLAQWDCPLWEARSDRGAPDAARRQHSAALRAGPISTGAPSSRRRRRASTGCSSSPGAGGPRVHDPRGRRAQPGRDRRPAAPQARRRSLSSALRYAAMTHWPGTLITDLVLRLADGRSESVGETRTRYLVLAHGLPAPEVNYPIHDERGREVARVDLAWPELGAVPRVRREGQVRAPPQARRASLRRRRAREAARGHDLPTHRLAMHPHGLGGPLPARDQPLPASASMFRPAAA